MPPKDLSRYFGYQKMLAVAGISVKGLLPERTLCPFCNEPSLTVYFDPVTDGLTQWLYCRECGFAGDTLEALHKIYGEDALIDTVDRAITEGLCSCPATEIRKEDIDEYETQIVGVRHAATYHWKSITQLLVKERHPSLVARARAERAWITHGSGAQYRLAELVGFARKDDIRRFYGPDKLRSYGFETVMVVADQDIPGRICRMRVLGENSEVFYPYGTYGETEGGLGMLDVLSFSEPIVFATSNVRDAVWLHRRNYVASDRPVPVITYDSATRNAWQHVVADKTVLWGDRLDLPIFLQAKRVVNAHVADGTQMQEFSRMMQEVSSRRVLKAIDEISKPWRKALAGWLCRMKANELEIRSIVRILELSEDDKEAVINDCLPDEVNRMRSILSGCIRVANQIKAVTVNGKTVLERDGGWYVMLPSGREELITNAPFRITRQVVDVLAAEVCWDGYVMYGNDRVQFTGISAASLQKRPVETLSEILARNGKGAITLHPNWKKYIVVIAQLLSDTKIVQTDTALGPDSRGDIIFPKFVLSDGAVVARPDGPPARVAAMPVPSRRKPCEQDRADKARACWAVLSSMFVNNWIAKMRGRQQTPCFVFGDDGTTASCVLDRFVKSMDIPTIKRLDDPSLPVLARMNYPYFLSTALTETMSGNFYTKMPIENGLIAATRMPCVLVADNDRWSADAFVPPADDLIWFLARIQTQDYEIPDEGPMWHVLEKMCEHLESYLGINASELMVATSKVCLNGLLPGERAIDLAIRLIQRGALEHGPAERLKTFLDSSSVPSGNFGVLEDNSGGLVYIDRGQVSAACQKLGLPQVGWERVEADLTTKAYTGAYVLRGGIIIQKKLFDRRAEWCRSAFA